MPQKWLDIVARRQKATERMSQLVESGEFVPPCHVECTGTIQIEVDGEKLIGQCPMLNKEPTCLIPSVKRRERDRDMIAQGWPRKYVLESVWEECRAASLVQKWLMNRQRGDGLLIHGPVGTGKTMTAALAAKALWDQGIEGRFVNAAELIMKLEDKKRSRSETIQELVGPPLLTLDDWGVVEPAPWTIGLIDLLVEKRASAGRPMIVTTNLTPKTLRSVPEWQRFVDRWADTMLAVSIPGKSMRGQNR